MKEQNRRREKRREKGRGGQDGISKSNKSDRYKDCNIREV